MENKSEVVVSFSKVDLPYGWMGNMSPYKIEFEGKIWLTSEALFQAMRFKDESIRELIRLEKSPMSAKMKAKKFKDQMVVIPMSMEDVENMKKCVRLKMEQHQVLREKLLRTGKFRIIEDIGIRRKERDMFWGAYKENDKWIGENTMGKIWMEIREELTKNV